MVKLGNGSRVGFEGENGGARHGSQQFHRSLSTVGPHFDDNGVVLPDALSNLGGGQRAWCDWKARRIGHFLRSISWPRYLNVRSTNVDIPELVTFCNFTLTLSSDLVSLPTATSPSFIGRLA